MAQVVRWTSDRANNDVVTDEENNATQLHLDHRTRQRKLSKVQPCDQCPGESEDSSGGPHAHPLWMQSCTCKSSGYSAGEVDRAERPSAIKGLAQRAEIPQAPHVERDMQKPAMQEAVTEQPPPLATEGERTIVGAGANELLP